MKKKVVVSILVNLVLTIGFVWGMEESLKRGLEETMVALAMIYGTIVTVINAIVVDRVK